MTAAPRGWLLDTNVISELRKGAKADQGVRSWAQAVPPGACFLSLVTMAEIRFGIERVTDLQFVVNSKPGSATAYVSGSAIVSWCRTRLC